MKNLITITLLTLAIMLTVDSCGDSSIDSKPNGITVNSPNTLSTAINIPGAILLDGNIPGPTSGDFGIKISDSTGDMFVMPENDGEIEISISYNENSKPNILLFKIKGSDEFRVIRLDDNLTPIGNSSIKLKKDGIQTAIAKIPVTYRPTGAMYTNQNSGYTGQAQVRCAQVKYCGDVPPPDMKMFDDDQNINSKIPDFWSLIQLINIIIPPYSNLVSGSGYLIFDGKYFPAMSIGGIVQNACAIYGMKNNLPTNEISAAISNIPAPGYSRTTNHLAWIDNHELYAEVTCPYNGTGYISYDGRVTLSKDGKSLYFYSYITEAQYIFEGGGTSHTLTGAIKFK
jgi:hypothetical protein